VPTGPTLPKAMRLSYMVNDRQGGVILIGGQTGKIPITFGFDICGLPTYVLIVNTCSIHN
jgi:uncharacterized membrane protein